MIPRYEEDADDDRPTENSPLAKAMCLLFLGITVAGGIYLLWW